MRLLHVVPTQDSKEHVVDLNEKCWCDPQVLEEGFIGEVQHESETHIHKPILPVVPGHTLNLVKMESKDGSAFYRVSQ